MTEIVRFSRATDHVLAAGFSFFIIGTALFALAADLRMLAVTGLMVLLWWRLLASRRWCIDASSHSTDDTTTPAAFTADLAAVLDGSTLGTDDTALLLDWMTGNATGDTLVRAGAPEGWTVADKSGGAGGIRNDVALVTRPGGAPIVLTVMTTRKDPTAPYDDALVAETASTVLAAFATAD